MDFTKEEQKALAEVYVIILKMNKELQDKIPIEIKQNIASYMDKQHWYEISMEMMPETKVLLSVIIEKYLADKKLKKKLTEYNRYYYTQSEEMKVKNYNLKKIFDITESKSEKNEEVEIIEYKESFLKRIMNKLKKLFKNNGVKND